MTFLHGHTTVLVQWAKERVQPSNFQTTTSADLYTDYVQFHKKLYPHEPPLPDYEWGVYVSQLFGPSIRKKVSGKIVRCRALVLK